MEFDFSINALFSDSISLITGDTTFSDKRGRYGTDHELEEIINTIGARSARAQNLSSSITTWPRLRINGHKIYLLINPSANNGRGHVLGFIKVGRKQLFVLDREGTHNEMHPLCVLDLYIHESQQRKGHGLKLFKHMLQAENVNPAHLAIDRPSSKFISFLRKHFKLWATLPQVNNFVVFDGFFKNRKDKQRRVRQRNQEFEDDFRPLSRGFSEDIIRRNRRNQSYNSGSLNGIRPISGLVTNGLQDNTNSRFQSSGQGSRTNRFSRFATDENSNVPANSQNRPKSLKSTQEDEIITNPYRRVTNVLSKGRPREERDSFQESQANSRTPDEIQPPDEELSEVKEQVKGCPDLPSQCAHQSREERSLHGIFPHSVNHRNDMPSEPKEAPSDSTRNNQMEPHTESRESLFEAKVGYNSIRKSQYGKPSDMILELQRKDQESKNRPIVGRPRNVSLFGTSWNVFGVPSPSRKKRPNQ